MLYTGNRIVGSNPTLSAFLSRIFLMHDGGEFGEPLAEKTRVVAQLGSAFDWGSKGRGFKSRQPDYQQMTEA